MDQNRAIGGNTLLWEALEVRNRKYARAGSVLFRHRRSVQSRPLVYTRCFMREMR
jgi:hypothetical protein